MGSGTGHYKIEMGVGEVRLVKSWLDGVSDAVGLDKWLWAARFYKTRAAATAAVAGGKVQVNGERAKPAKMLRPGDAVRVRLGPYEHHVVVGGVAEKRGPPNVGHRRYEENPETLW